MQKPLSWKIKRVVLLVLWLTQIMIYIVKFCAFIDKKLTQKNLLYFCKSRTVSDSIKNKIVGDPELAFMHFHQMCGVANPKERRSHKAQ